MSTTRRPRLLGRTTIYNGRVFRVEVDRVKLPNGRTVPMEMVRHRGSVVLLPEPSPGYLVLIRQYRYAIGKWIWELPAGSREPGEPLPVCARRECEEEIGLRPRRVRHVGTFYPTPGFCDELMAFFHCTDLRTPKGPIRRDVDEDLEPKTHSLSEAQRLVRLGRIVDMKTIVGLGLIAGVR